MGGERPGHGRRRGRSTTRARSAAIRLGLRRRARVVDADGRLAGRCSGGELGYALSHQRAEAARAGATWRSSDVELAARAQHAGGRPTAWSRRSMRSACRRSRGSCQRGQRLRQSGGRLRGAADRSRGPEGRTRSAARRSRSSTPTSSSIRAGRRRDDVYRLMRARPGQGVRARGRLAAARDRAVRAVDDGSRGASASGWQPWPSERAAEARRRSDGQTVRSRDGAASLAAWAFGRLLALGVLRRRRLDRVRFGLVRSVPGSLGPRPGQRAAQPGRRRTPGGGHGRQCLLGRSHRTWPSACAHLPVVADASRSARRCPMSLDVTIVERQPAAFWISGDRAIWSTARELF